MTDPTRHTTEVHVAGVGPVPVTWTERGEGPALLLLHGGGGPGTVAGWADRYAADSGSRVITPIHPGFDGTPRPDGFRTIGGLAQAYAALLDALDLRGVTVLGNSIGGWIAAELALVGSDRVTGYLLVDAVGIAVPDHPVVDFFSLTPPQVAELSYHDPATYGIDPSRLPPEALAAMAGNRATLAVYAGAMTDPTLAGRLSDVRGPVLVLWGDSDRIADLDYGRAYAAAIAGARFEVIPRTGHLPQIESPAALTDLVRGFVTSRLSN